MNQLNFLEELNTTKNQLAVANVFLILCLVVFSNLGFLPFGIGDFLFFCALVLAAALYRPGWVFLLFIGTLVLENVNLAPEALGLGVRPYQILGAATIIALIARTLSGKINFSLARPNLWDGVIFLPIVGSFLSIFNAPDKTVSLKLAVIFLSFYALYFLARNYLREKEDFGKILPFFLGSAIVILIYGIWQNIRFSQGLSNFEVMPGRPNATFAEPDWLGSYLVLVISIVYALIYYCHSERSSDVIIGTQSKNLLLNSDSEKYSRDPSTAFQIFRLNGKFETSLRMTSLYVFLILSYILLILTVSRSAWLGTIAATFIFLFAIWTNLKFDYKTWHWKKTLQIKLLILSAFLIALGSVFVFQLTDFQLFNRVQSVGTGLQKITLACVSDPNLSKDKIISDISELEKYACRHINLEDIEKEKAMGNVIGEVYRKDPNVSIRGEIYQKSWTEIKKHPFLGIGWGSIGKILGNDEHGSSFNSSNVFLEVWLGSGLLGLLAFLGFLGYVFWQALLFFYSSKDPEIRTIGLFILVSGVGMLVFNIFNAGMFLAFLWIWMGMHGIKNKVNME